MNAVPTACVIGWPISHSRSPVIHRFWLRELGIEGDYVPVAVEPERLAEFMARFPENYVGGNVTVPHKEAVIAAVAGTDAAARAIGAVNTLWMEAGKVVGGNTDALGFLANLDESVESWDENPGGALVFGAGGAARAVVFGLRERGFAPIHLVNRTAARAEALAERFGDVVRPAGWDAAERLLGQTQLLVNTTTLGMKESEALDIELSHMRDDAIVTDLVYVPLETPLLAAARTRGLRTADGLGMLLHQAVPGFERWFGQRPSVSPDLRAAVLETFES